MAELVALCIGVFGVAGVIFTALRFNRDDTTAIVNQQTTLLNNMKSLYESEHIELESVKAERDALRLEIFQLRPP